MGVFGRSWSLYKASFRVLMADRELLVLGPVALVAFVFHLGLVLLVAWSFSKIAPDGWGAAAGILLVFFLYAFGMTVLVTFLNAMVMAAATERLQGGNPNLQSAFGKVWSRKRSLLTWTLIASTVGFLLAFVALRGGASRIVPLFGGVAWNLATFLIVPVLVLQRLDVGASLRRSQQIFRSTWGESLAGIVGLGLPTSTLALLVMFPGLGVAVGVPGWLAQQAGASQEIQQAAVATGMVIWFLALLASMGLAAILQGIYKAALYPYTQTGRLPECFGQAI